MSNTVDPTLGNGKICYLQIPAIDIAAAASFYSKVFGWKIRTRGDGVTAFDDGVGQVSGMWVSNRPPLTTIGILIFIMVDDIHAVMDSITTAGGKIVEPIGLDAPEITARFSDPTGNILGIFQQ